jgi:hypothetical protein
VQGWWVDGCYKHFNYTDAKLHPYNLAVKKVCSEQFSAAANGLEQLSPGLSCSKLKSSGLCVQNRLVQLLRTVSNSRGDGPRCANLPATPGQPQRHRRLQPRRPAPDLQPDRLLAVP